MIMKTKTHKVKSLHIQHVDKACKYNYFIKHPKPVKAVFRQITSIKLLIIVFR